MVQIVTEEHSVLVSLVAPRRGDLLKGMRSRPRPRDTGGRSVRYRRATERSRSAHTLGDCPTVGVTHPKEMLREPSAPIPRRQELPGTGSVTFSDFKATGNGAGPVVGEEVDVSGAP